jgi:hypothetical protein
VRCPAWGARHARALLRSAFAKKRAQLCCVPRSLLGCAWDQRQAGTQCPFGTISPVLAPRIAPHGSLLPGRCARARTVAHALQPAGRPAAERSPRRSPYALGRVRPAVSRAGRFHVPVGTECLSPRPLSAWRHGAPAPEHGSVPGQRRDGQQKTPRGRTTAMRRAAGACAGPCLPAGPRRRALTCVRAARHVT